MSTLVKNKKNGPDRGLNPEPLAPKARIIPLDHQAALIKREQKPLAHLIVFGLIRIF